MSEVAIAFILDWDTEYGAKCLQLPLNALCEWILAVFIIYVSGDIAGWLLLLSQMCFMANMVVWYSTKLYCCQSKCIVCIIFIIIIDIEWVSWSYSAHFSSADCLACDICAFVLLVVAIILRGFLLSQKKPSLKHRVIIKVCFVRGGKVFECYFLKKTSGITFVL